MLAAVSVEDAAFRRKGPTDDRFYIDTKMPGRIELDAAGAEQPECGTIFADNFSVERSAHTQIALAPRTQLNVKPFAGGQSPVQSDRDAQIMDELDLVSGRIRE